MVTRIRHEFYCDQPGCRRGYYLEGRYAQAVRCAQSIGWIICGARGKDYCPDHRTPRERRRVDVVLAADCEVTA